MNTNPPSAILESYVRTADFEEHAATLELSPALWDIFALTEDRVTAADIARSLGIEATAAHLGLRELTSHRLVRRHVQSWRDYRAAAPEPAPAPPPAQPVPAPAAPAATVPPPAMATGPATGNRPATRLNPPAPPPPVRAESIPAAATPPCPRVTAPPAPREIRFALAAPERRRPEPRHLIRFALRRTGAPRSASALPEAPAPAAAGWRLRPILDAISRHGGGNVTGQLLAYRVFLGIPAELLDRAGLYSLSLTENDFTIHDSEFYAALRRSVREVAGIEIETIAGAAAPAASSLP